MVMTGSITGLLTRIRDTDAARREVVEVPSSGMKRVVASILLQEGYIKGLEECNDGAVLILGIPLKCGADKERVVAGVKRISKPGLRAYCKKSEIPKILNGLGITVISASTGLLVDREARRAGLGGEIVCYVW